MRYFICLALSLCLCLATVLEERVELSVKEGLPSGTLVGQILRKPGYTYTLNERNRWFSFEPRTGQIRTATLLDREALGADSVDLVIVGSSPAYFITVHIKVLDLNDNSPAFPFPFQNISLPESARVGTQVLIANAVDPDAGRNGEISRYGLLNHREGVFELVQSNDEALLLQLVKKLDRESQALYILNVSAVDSGPTPHTGYLTVFVNVLDANDNAPIFAESHYEVSIPESVPQNHQILSVNATDLDIGLNSQLTYLISNEPEHQFRIDPLSGVISSAVDKLKCPCQGDKCQCVFTVEAQDAGNPAQRGRAFVNVQLIDENDHRPKIGFQIVPAGAEQAILDEGAPLGTVVAVVTVVDGDAGLNGDTRVEIESGNEMGHFRLDSNDLFSLLKVNDKLDRNKARSYNLSILASDHGTPPLVSRRFLPVTIRDAHDLPPKFPISNLQATVPENSPPGTFVASLTAQSSSTVTYAIESGNELGLFSLDSRTGLLRTAASIDFESVRTATLSISASNARSVQKARARVQISILDQNDHSPSFSQDVYEVSLPENTVPGASVVTLRATDPDSGKNGEIFFRLESEILQINPYSGLVALKSELDRETADTYRIPVLAYDIGLPQRKAEAEILLRVSDVNDNSPTFEPRDYYANLLKTAPVGSLISRVQATDADSGENGMINYFIMQAPVGAFDLDTNSGELRLRKLPNTRANRLEVVIGARDFGDQQAVDNATVYISLLENMNQIPTFSRSSFDFQVLEDSMDFGTVGKVIGTVSATDNDALLPVEYKITTGDPENIFEIGRYSGEIRSSRPLDRETQDLYELRVTAGGNRGVAETGVTVSILDANDNSPVFVTESIENSRAQVVIDKNTPVGEAIFVASAVDRDVGLNSLVKYSLKPDDFFRVDETGMVALKTPAFLLKNDSFELEILVSDSGKPMRTSKLNLLVRVTSSQEMMLPRKLHFVVAEDTPVNSFIEKLNHSFPGALRIVFAPTYPEPDALFSVFPDGWLFVKNELDYEQTREFELDITITAQLSNERQVTSQLSAHFHITDVNDNSPQCRNSTSVFHLPENSPPYSVIGMVRAEDGDTGLNGHVTYSLIGAEEHVTLDGASGVLRSLKTFDRELMMQERGRAEIQAKVVASDGGLEPKTTQCEVRIVITDQNDHAPEFSLDLYQATVPENTELGAEILRATATDQDSGENAEITYKIMAGNEENRFQINSTTGALVLAKQLDRESTPRYRLELLAQDNGTPSLSTSAFASISVSDVNDNVPSFIEFPKYGLNLSESIPVGSLVAQFTATDPDSGPAGQLRYSISSGNIGRSFEIDVLSGRMVLVKALEFETVPAYTISITASDQGSPTLSTSVPVVINILDENDNAPEIEAAMAQVVESVPPGSPVITLKANDMDSGPNGKITFELAEQIPVSAFRIDENTGTVYTNMELDREAIDSYRLRVIAHDQPTEPSTQLWSERWLTIIVTDANDHAPLFTGPHAASLPLQSASSGYRLAKLRAFDPDAGVNGTVGFEIVQEDRDNQGLFSLALDGSLYIQRRLYNPKALYHLRVQAADQSDITRRFSRQLDDSGLSQSTSIQFTVVTVGTEPSGIRFARNIYGFDVSEETTVGSEVGTVSATGSDLEYYITSARANDSDSEMPIDIDQKSGVLRVVRPLDRESLGSTLLLEISAVSVSSQVPRSASCEAKITILDSNDQMPRPERNQYYFQVPEDAQIGTSVGKISASDPDLQGQISFGLTSAVREVAIDDKTGVIRTKSALDREKRDKLSFTVAVSDGLHSTFVAVRLEIMDANDNSPWFVFEEQLSDSYSFQIMEGAERNTFIGKIHAVDPDLEENGNVKYSFMNANMAAVFRLDEDTGVIRVNGPLDHDKDPIYIIEVQAQDGGNPPRRSRAKVYILVQDSNDNPPSFSHNSYSATVFENATVGTQLVQLSATDPDTDTVLYYTVTAGDPWEQFSVNSNGTVFVAKALDREKRSDYQLTVTVADRRDVKGLVHSARVTVAVSVRDVNDCPPVFLGPHVVLVNENEAIGKAVAQFEARDDDEGANGHVEFHLSPSSSPFSVDSVSGHLRVNGPLNFRSFPTYNLTLILTDRGYPALSSTAHIQILVIENQQKAAEFLKNNYSLSVPENTAIGSSLMQISVKQMAANSKLWLENADFFEFSLDARSGVLRLAQSLDFERREKYEIQIALGNSDSWKVSDRAFVHLTVTDFNDSPPTFRENPIYIDVVENLNFPAIIGKAEAEDFDSGINSKLSYSIIQGNTSLFAIDSLNGNLKITGKLDREILDFYELVVQVTDNGTPRLSSTGQVVITVLDKNDNSPIFDQPYYSIEISENSTIGAAVVQLHAKDNDLEANGLVRYSLQNAKNLPFKIDSKSGLIETVELLDREIQSSYELTVIAQDSAPGIPLKTETTVYLEITDINDHAPVIRNKQLDVYIKKTLKTGEFVYAIDASDPDSGENGRLSYVLTGRDSSKFHLDQSTGVISASISLLSREHYSLIISVHDNGSPQSLSSSTTLNFYTRPAAHFPVFKAAGSVLSFRISEAQQKTEIATLIARSTKQLPQSKIHYSIAAGNKGEAFEIDPESGKLRSTEKLDREQEDRFELWIAGTDSDTPPLSSHARVLITVTDINDNKPQFTQALYNASISENELPLVPVVQVQATDRDTGKNSEITYSILPHGNEDEAFSVDTQTGTISTLKSLNREHVAEYQLTVRATDGGDPALSSEARVLIKVLDKNDNSPKFKRLFAAKIPEDAPVGSFVIQLTSVDPDSPQFSNNSYYFTNNPGDKFAIDPVSGNVTVAAPLDREVMPEYTLKVKAVDGAWRIETSLVIEIEDKNDNRPIFNQAVYWFAIEEMQPALSKLGHVTAVDRDSGDNSKVHYSLASKSNLFSINQQTGEVFTLKPLTLDRAEKNNSNIHQLTVIAKDEGRPPMQSTSKLLIKVTERNVHAPEFEQDSYEVAVSSNAPIGSPLVQTTATDEDLGSSGEVQYSMVHDVQHSGLFEIDSQSGWLKTAGAMASEGTIYEVSVKAADSGNPEKSETAKVTIQVVPQNSDAPEFSNDVYELQVKENVPIGTAMARIDARDPDQGLNGKLTFSIKNQGAHPAFTIDPQTGTVTTAAEIDFEAESEYLLIVSVQDSGFPPKIANAPLTISVLDENDHAPLFEKDSFDAFVAENSPTETVIWQLKAEDLDSDLHNKISYSISSGNEQGFFQVNPESGIVTVAAEGLDYESQKVYQLQVEAKNPGSDQSSTTMLNIHVTSVNEFSPRFSNKQYEFSIPESAQIGVIVGKIEARDSDLGPDGVVYYFLDHQSRGRGFDIIKDTGEVTVSTKLNRSAYPSLTLTALAKNRNTANPAEMDSCQIKIRIDPASAVPYFDVQDVVVDRPEDSPVGTSITQLNTSPSIQYSIENDIGGHFSVNSHTGLVQLQQQLDRETQDVHEFKIMASGRLMASVHVNVLDVNDNAPTLPPGTNVGYIMESDPAGTGIMTLLPSDADLDPNRGPFMFRLASPQLQSLFELDQKTGVIRSRVVFDREEQEVYELQVEISDAGQPTQRALQKVTVEVTDRNDMPSTSEPVQLIVNTVSEVMGAGPIGSVQPVDPDKVGDYKCKLLDSPAKGYFTMADGCILRSKQILRPPANYQLSLSGTDGIHSWVDYDVTVQLKLISQDQLENAVQVDFGVPKDKVMSAVQDLSLSLKNRRLTAHLIALDTDENAFIYLMHINNNAVMTGVEAATLLKQLSPSSKVQFDLCTADPCHNGGTCRMVTQITSSFENLQSGSSRLAFAPVKRVAQCTCAKSYAGDKCERLIDHCANSPCLNGGSCTHGPTGAVMCQCPANYEGELCEKDVNECKSASGSPCQNGGYCENTQGGYRCICMLGYTGINCDQSVDHCASNPCKNSGECIKNKHGYSCECKQGFDGKNCEIRSYGFDKLSYVELAPLDPNENFVTLQFATFVPNAVLLYSYNKAPQSIDYVALDIVDGRLRLSAQLSGQGQMNLILEPRLNDGKYHQVQIEHKFQSVTVSVAHCIQDECAPCAAGNNSCQITAYTGVPQILVPGDSIFLGGVKSFGDLLDRPGQLSSFEFVGCIRDFEINGEQLDERKIKSKSGLLDYCPRPAEGYCTKESNPCGESKCFDKWNRNVCFCQGQYEAEDCGKAEQSYSFNGGVVVYSLSESYRRSILFRPVDTKTLVNSDDLFRKKRAAPSFGTENLGQKLSAPYDLSLEIDFRTLSTDAIILLAASGNDFTIIDIINGTLRYLSSTGGNKPLHLSLDKFGTASDGNWHRVWLVLREGAHVVEFRMDGLGKTAKARQPVHQFLDSRLEYISVGGVRSNKAHYDKQEMVTVFGVDVPDFAGCLRRFVLNHQSQPLTNGSSPYLTGSQLGQVQSGCSSAQGCVSPPCTSSPLEGPNYLWGVVVVVAFFLLLIAAVVVIGCFVRRRRFKKQKQLQPQHISQPLSPSALVSGSATTLKADSAWSVNNHHVAAYDNRVMSELSIDDVVTVNPSGTQISARYDLDNASSIAPSDIDVATHYRAYRQGSYGRGKNTHPDRQSPLSQLVALNAHSRNSPASVKQLKAALRASPASLATDTTEEDVPRQRSRPGSSKSSKNSSLKRPKHKAQPMSVKDLRRFHSNPTFEGDSSSSSGNEAPRAPPRQILSRPPRPAPSRHSSSEESLECSILDLDKVRKPRKLVVRSTDSETESEVAIDHSVPSSLAPFRPPRSMFPVSEDESGAPSAFRPIPPVPPRHRNRSKSPPSWYHQEERDSSTPEPSDLGKNARNMEAYV